MSGEKSQKQNRIGVIGAGAWGTAIAKVLTEAGHKVDIWCYEPEIAEEINTKHANSKYLIGVALPEGGLLDVGECRVGPQHSARRAVSTLVPANQTYIHSVVAESFLFELRSLRNARHFRLLVHI